MHIIFQSLIFETNTSIFFNHLCPAKCIKISKNLLSRLTNNCRNILPKCMLGLSKIAVDYKDVIGLDI